MIKKGFDRRQFISSMEMGTLGLMLSNPVFSFGNTIEKLHNFQKSDLLFYIDSKGKIKPVTTLTEWNIKRRQIIERMQQVMGKLPDMRNLPDMNIQIIDELKEESYTCLNIIFTVVENEKVPAYLYIPFQKGKPRKLPAMLALHPTGSLGKKITDGQGALANRAYARELAQRGYVVIAPDYPGFGDLKNYDFKSDRYQSGTMKSIFNNFRCVDLLQSRTDVDPDRIGVIGHSLGGHNAIFTGAFDKRLKVIVSSCGWTLMDYYNPGKEITEKSGDALRPWAQELYMPLLADKYHLDIKQIPFDFDEIIATLAPRAFFSSSPLKDSNFNVDGVKKGIAKV
jgi:acetyl esterase/lipase